MRRSEGPAVVEGLPLGQETGNRINLGDLDVLLPRQRRQDGGDTFGNHGFAGAGSAGEEKIVAAGGRDQRSPYREALAPDFGEVHVIMVTDGAFFSPGTGESAEVLLGLQQRLQLLHTAEADDIHVFHHQGLLDILHRHYGTAETGLPERSDHGERAGNMPDLSVQAHLPEEAVVIQRKVRQLSAGAQDAGENGQIEAGAVLAAVGRLQIDGETPGRQVELLVFQRHGAALQGFPDAGGDIAHNDVAGQSVAFVYLHGNQVSVHAVDTCTVYFC